MAPVVRIAGPGYFFAERQPGLVFSRICWHAAGHEETVVPFINGFYLANDIADQMNRRLTKHD